MNLEIHWVHLGCSCSGSLMKLQRDVAGFISRLLPTLTWRLGWEQANSWEWEEAGKVWAPGHLLMWTLHMMPQVTTPLPSRLKGQSKCTMENGKLLVFSRPTSAIMHPCFYYILFIKTVVKPCSRSRAGDRHCLLVGSWRIYECVLEPPQALGLLMGSCTL